MGLISCTHFMWDIFYARYGSYFVTNLMRDIFMCYTFYAGPLLWSILCGTDLYVVHILCRIDFMRKIFYIGQVLCKIILTWDIFYEVNLMQYKFYKGTLLCVEKILCGNYFL